MQPILFTWTELAAYFEHTSQLLGTYDSAELLGQLRQELAVAVADNFAHGHAPDGAPWAPLRHPRPGQKPLVRSGALLAASVEAACNAAISPEGLTLDTSLLPPYWQYQQQGTHTIPPRPFLGFPLAFTYRAEELLAQDVLAKMMPPF